MAALDYSNDTSAQVPSSSDAREDNGGPIWAMLHPDAAWRGHTPWTSIASQIVLIAAASALYWVVRNVTADQAVAAFANASDIVAFEASLGIAWEATAQGMVIEHQSIITMCNWVYMWFHWPVILFALFWTFFRDRSGYVLFRNAVIVSGLIGLGFFAFFPVAPPRLHDPASFLDSLDEFSISYRYLQPKSIVNQYAALPSFHVGWNLLSGFALYRSTRSLALRSFSVVSPILMSIAVVLTANHWVVDILAGAAIAGVSMACAMWFKRRRADQQAQPAATPPPLATS